KRTNPDAADQDSPRRFFVVAAPTGQRRVRMDRDVVIFDTTLRDGEQAPGNSMTPEEKLRLARQLDVLGVDVLETGFPAASDGDFRGVRDVAQEVRRAAIRGAARWHPPASTPSRGAP